MEATLYCLTCLNDTVHEVTYVDNILYEVRCEECNKKHSRVSDIQKELYLNYLERILSKPKRVKQEARGNLPHFLFSLPYRVMSKPFRAYSEFRDIIKYRRNV